MRRLSADEAALWQQLAQTVTPIRGRRNPPRARLGGGDQPQAGGGTTSASSPFAKTASPRDLASTGFAGGTPARGKLGEDLGRSRPLDRTTLDAGWDRRLGKGVVQPDFTLDLHGHTLDSAHARLDHGLTQALAQGARVLLLITGKPRSGDELSARGERRGAIRAKVLDWLAAGAHASRIAAVRPAHPRHGGAGALYIVLKRAR